MTHDIILFYFIASAVPITPHLLCFISIASPLPCESEPPLSHFRVLFCFFPLRLGSQCKHRRTGCYQSHQTGTGWVISSFLFTSTCISSFSTIEFKIIKKKEGPREWNFKYNINPLSFLHWLPWVTHIFTSGPSKASTCQIFIIRLHISPAGEDFAVVQQEIIMMKDCKHSNIVAYFGSYLR